MSEGNRRDDPGRPLLALPLASPGRHGHHAAPGHQAAAPRRHGAPRAQAVPRGHGPLAAHHAPPRRHHAAPRHHAPSRRHAGASPRRDAPRPAGSAGRDAVVYPVVHPLGVWSPGKVPVSVHVVVGVVQLGRAPRQRCSKSRSVVPGYRRHGVFIWFRHVPRFVVDHRVHQCLRHHLICVLKVGLGPAVTRAAVHGDGDGSGIGSRVYSRI
mmetsp:Transcript_20727/g.45419  ORF Transcript_20727/g.45419 Transcript_20727/m.45419 type:complete len:211 (+) Transcript_20727:327-959(+)